MKLEILDKLEMPFLVLRPGRTFRRKSFATAFMRRCSGSTLEIRVPEDCIGKVIGDLSGRRGRVVGMEAGSRLEVVQALVPARELYRYAGQLRSLTGGRGLHTEEFSHFEELPADWNCK